MFRVQEAQLVVDVYASAEQEAKRSEEDQKARHQKLKEFRSHLKERVRKRSEMKQRAMDQITCYYNGAALVGIVWEAPANAF